MSWKLAFNFDAYFFRWVYYPYISLLQVVPGMHLREPPAGFRAMSFVVIFETVMELCGWNVGTTSDFTINDIVLSVLRSTLTIFLTSVDYNLVLSVSKFSMYQQIYPLCCWIPLQVSNLFLLNLIFHEWHIYNQVFLYDLVRKNLYTFTTTITVARVRSLSWPLRVCSSRLADSCFLLPYKVLRKRI